jgi:hypothetical protein
MGEAPMTTANGLLPLGKHFYRIEGDLIYLQFHRNLELSETIEISQILDNLYSRHHRLFMVCDLLNATFIDAEARKYFGHKAKNIRMLATASIGANILQKTISVFMLNAIKIFTKGHFTQAFFDNETDARGWLEKQRAAFDLLQNKTSQS